MSVDFANTARVALELQKRWPKALGELVWIDSTVNDPPAIIYLNQDLLDPDARDLLAGRLLRALKTPRAIVSLKSYCAEGWRAGSFGNRDERRQRHNRTAGGLDPLAALAALALSLPPGTKLFAQGDGDGSHL